MGGGGGERIVQRDYTDCKRTENSAILLRFFSVASNLNNSNGNNPETFTALRGGFDRRFIDTGRSLSVMIDASLITTQSRLKPAPVKLLLA